ncbi:MAG: hypothetical protein ACREI6_05690 [Candidatus Rokuibacteriota bacterium]
MTRPALFVVKATGAPELEAAFNECYDTVRSKEAARVPGCLGMRRYAAIPLETPHAGSEPWQVHGLLRVRLGRVAAGLRPVRHAAGDDEGLQRPLRRRGRERARLAYRQIYP